MWNSFDRTGRDLTVVSFADVDTERELAGCRAPIDVQSGASAGVKEGDGRSAG